MESIVIDVLRTPELQRLGRIRQMGLAHLVFPGAEHSRLIHSLGASYLAIRFGRQIRETAQNYLAAALCPDESSIADMALAALCHDIGHGPFSHQWEREIIGGDSYDFAAWRKSLGLPKEADRLRGCQWHELVGQAILGWEDGDLHQLLEQQEDGLVQRLQQLLAGRYYVPYLPRILDSDIDIDRCDYLLRDAAQTGVKYGKFDLSWLLSTCTIGERPQGMGLTIGFEARKSVRVVEQFLIARRAMYDMVYQHKTTRSAEGMMGLFLRRLREVVRGGQTLAVPAQLAPLMRVVAGDAVSPQELMSLDDHAVWSLISVIAASNDMDETVADLGQRLLSRNLFKLVPVSSRRINEFLSDRDKHQTMLDVIERFCPGKPEYYYHVERSTCEVLSSSEAHYAYFIDDNHKATPVRDHEALGVYAHERPAELVQLFTIKEALPAVTGLIE